MDTPQGENSLQNRHQNAHFAPHSAHRPPHFHERKRVPGGLLTSSLAARYGLLLLCLVLPLGALAVEGQFAPQFLQKYQDTRAAFLSKPKNVTNCWRFARACFELGDYATNNTERAAIAEQGIAAARRAIDQQSNSAPAHYILALNYGQLARTKTLGALRLVAQMEHEFLVSIALDEHFDYAGAERSLGLLYRDAPSFGSIGSRSKARQHLLRAVQLAPNYPENHLILVESCLKWNDRNAARKELAELETGLEPAHKEFSGPAWAPSWADWEGRIAELRKTLGEPPKPLPTPRNQP